MLTSAFAQTAQKKHYTFTEAKRLFGERAGDVSSFLFTRLEDPVTGRRIDPIEPKANLGNLRVSQKAINEAQELLRSPDGLVKIGQSVSDFQKVRFQAGQSVRTGRAGVEPKPTEPQKYTPRTFGQRMTAADPLATLGGVSAEEQAERLKPTTESRMGISPKKDRETVFRALADKIGQGTETLAGIQPPGATQVGTRFLGALAASPAEGLDRKLAVEKNIKAIREGKKEATLTDVGFTTAGLATAAIDVGLLDVTDIAKGFRHLKLKALENGLKSADRTVKETALKVARATDEELIGKPVEQTAKEQGVGLTFRKPESEVDVPGVTFRPKKAEAVVSVQTAKTPLFGSPRAVASESVPTAQSAPTTGAQVSPPPGTPARRPRLFEGTQARSQTGATPAVSRAETPTTSVPKGLADEAPTESTGTSPKHESVDSLRETYGLGPRSKSYKSDDELKAAAKSLEPEAVNIAREANASKRILKDDESLAVAGTIERRRTEFAVAQKTALQAADEPSRIAAQAKADRISDEMQDMALALDESGTEGARSQRARRFVAKALEGHAEPDIRYRFESGKSGVGRKATEVESETIKRQAADIAALETQLVESEVKAATDRDYIATISKRITDRPARARGAANRVFKQDAYDQAVKRFASAGAKGKTSGATTIPSDIADLVVMAGYHIESGVRSLPEIVSAVRKVAPGVSDADLNIAVGHALDAIDAKPRKAVKAAVRTLKDLRAEVKASMGGSDIADAMKRIDELEAVLTDPTKGLDELESAWSDLTKLRQKYGQGSSIGFDTLVSGKYGVQSDAVAELRYRLDSAKQDSAKFVSDARRKAEYESASTLGKIAINSGKAYREIKALPAQLVASLDVSYTGRQGIWFSLNPRYAKESKAMLKGQFESMLTEDGYKRTAYAIRQNKNYDRFRKVGGVLDGDQFGAENAEMFESLLLKHWKKFNPYEASGRAYEMGGNVQRMQMFDNIVSGIERNGKALDDEGLKLIANYVNSATGRGTTKFTKALQNLQVLWAPKLVGGRFELLAGQPLIKAVSYGVRKGDWRLARRVMEDYAAFGTMMTAVFYGAHLAGAEVNVSDPDSPDWLKIKIGNLRIDPLAGFQQTGRFVYRMFDAMMKSAMGEKAEWGKGATDTAGRFLRSKLSPLHSEASNWLLFDRKDYVGQDVTPESTLTNLTTPLGGRELFRDSKDDPGKAALAYFLNFWGVGSNQYEDKKPKSTGRLFSR